MRNLPIEYFEHVVRGFFKPYYENNDKAHLIDHADSVVHVALDLFARMNPSVGNQHILVVAGYAHDMFTAIDRENHHTMVRDYILSDEFKSRNFLHEEEYAIAADAAYCHRKSTKLTPSHITGHILKTADRGVPCATTYYLRSYLYAIDRLGYSPERAYTHALNHIGEYLQDDSKFTDLTHRYFSTELTLARETADTMTTTKLVPLLAPSLLSRGLR